MYILRQQMKKEIINKVYWSVKESTLNKNLFNKNIFEIAFISNFPNRLIYHFDVYEIRSSISICTFVFRVHPTRASPK